MCLKQDRLIKWGLVAWDPWIYLKVMMKESGFSSEYDIYNWFGYLDTTQFAEKDNYSSTTCAVNDLTNC